MPYKFDAAKPDVLYNTDVGRLEVSRTVDVESSGGRFTVETVP